MHLYALGHSLGHSLRHALGKSYMAISEESYLEEEEEEATPTFDFSSQLMLVSPLTVRPQTVMTVRAQIVKILTAKHLHLTVKTLFQAVNRQLKRKSFKKYKKTYIFLF